MNSPAIPDRCPKCGTDFLRDSNGAIQFHCGSVSKRGYIGVRIETAICTGRQRDQLAERVKRLEEAGDALIDAIQSVQCWNETHVGECINQFKSWRGSQ